MKKAILLFALLTGFAFTSNAQYTTYQSGYVKKNGTYVQPSIRTTPNATNWDNYSTQGNSNPYNGNSGTRARDYSMESLNYGSGQVIQTGERGGQYYINSNGNKVYVPKQ